MEKLVFLKNETGLHARPAGLFVSKASKYKSSVKIKANGNLINAKSIMNILSLGLEKGAEFTIIAEGEDEAVALSELVTLIESGFEGN